VGKVLPLYFPTGCKSPIVLVAGLGERDQWNRGTAYRALGTATRWLTDRKRRSLAIAADPAWTAAQLEGGVAGAVAGCHGPGLYQAEAKRFQPEQLLWLGTSDDSLSSGRIVADGVVLTRRLVNEPPSTIYPETFAEQATAVAKATGMSCEIWDEQQLANERCGSLLAVARGSSRSPRLVILSYQGGDKNVAPLALVGKGVTFDSGGLSLKPSDGMLAMKCDMAGAATVLGAMQAIAQLKLPVNVIGLMGLVENMPSASAYKLGDVLTARNGKTIEVHNTDAEGRLVLADVLCVAVDRGAERIIDLATLTGACMVALGNDVAGVMTNDQTWCDTVMSCSQSCGEPLWQLPMFAEYGEQIRSSVADIKNVGEGRWGGAITAAKLLEEFVDKKPWAHLDIAGPAFLEKPKPWSDVGGSGIYVQTLVEVARSL
ncbi:MAG: leucyl aminopeptidase, partial [Planctomycetales bacterium]|nr:leucyl aminopeptidase [Planctomycetales bacterium]